MKLFLIISFLTCQVWGLTFTTSATTRTINTNFIPSATRYVTVNYSFSLNNTATILGGSTSTIELRSDIASVPTTVRANCTAAFTVALAIAITLNSTVPCNLQYFVPPGHSVRISTTGTGTVSFNAQVEQTLQPEFDGVNFSTGFPFK